MLTPTPAYRVECRYAHHDGRWNVVSEWHWSLPSALEALAEHQQRHWDVVSLVPSVGPRTPRHLPLAFGVRHAS